MKKIFCKLICLILIICLIMPSARAESDAEAFNQLYQAVLEKSMPMLEGDAIPYGKLLFAVYEYEEEEVPRLSYNEIESGEYHGIPREKLASSFSDAQTVILIYPREIQSSPVQTYVYTTVCVVDQIQHACYEAWWADRKQKIITPVINLGPGLGTIGGNSNLSMNVDEAVNQVLLRMEKAAEAADETLYHQAEQHYEEGLFYTARQEFLSSLWGDWNERAAACEQPWPENGEVWKNYLIPVVGMRLTIRVNQPEESAFFARLYKDGQAYSGLFIGGSGEATADLPGGIYSIRTGTGSNWYGGRELFGSAAPYEIMTFDEYGTEEVELELGYSYTLSIHVEEAISGEGVGSEAESWENIIE